MVSENAVRNRIRNLLALANDSGAYEHEKTASFLMAQKMMLKYNLSEEDCVESDITDDQRLYRQQKEVYVKPITDYVTLKFWQGSLAMIIAPNFKCFTYTNSWDKKKRLVFLGMREDTEIASDVFEFASEAILYHSKEYIDSRDDIEKSKRVAVKNDYINGYLMGLKDKFDKQVEENNFQLALVKHELVVQEYDKLNLRSGRRSSVSGAGDRGARDKGFEDGKNFNYGNARLE